MARLRRILSQDRPGLDIPTIILRYVVSAAIGMVMIYLLDIGWRKLLGE